MKHTASAHVKCEHCWKLTRYYHNGGDIHSWLYIELPKYGWFRKPVTALDITPGPWFCGQTCYNSFMAANDRERNLKHQKVITSIFKQKPTREMKFKKFCRETHIPLKAWLPILLIWILIISLVVKGCM